MKTYRKPNIDTSVHMSLSRLLWWLYCRAHFGYHGVKEQIICKTERKCIERQARIKGPSPISSTLTCSYCPRETNDHVGLKSLKRRKLPNMTIAAEWGAKPQIKQISHENFPHGRHHDNNVCPHLQPLGAATR